MITTWDEKLSHNTGRVQHTPFNSSFTLYRWRALVASNEEGDFIIVKFEPFKLLMNVFALTNNYSNCSCLSYVIIESWNWNKHH